MYRRRIKRPPPPTFGETLEELKYSIDEHGHLIDESGKQYVFDLKAKNREYQEAHARALGDAIMRIMIKRIEDECGMVKATVPVDAEGTDTPYAHILISNDAKDCKRLLVLVASTNESLGSWSRRLLANHHVEIGSMLSVVRWARQEGFGVLITNPNTHFWVDGCPSLTLPINIKKQYKMIPNSGSPEEHVDYVLRQYVQTFASREIFFIAHKYGGHALIQALHEQFDAFKDRVSAVAVIDSSHTITPYPESKFRKWLSLNTVTYMQSEQGEKGKVEFREIVGCNCVMAGSQEFDFTIVDAMPDIFKFFQARKDRDNTLEKHMNEIVPLREDDPTTAMVAFDADDGVDDEADDENVDETVVDG